MTELKGKISRPAGLKGTVSSPQTLRGSIGLAPSKPGLTIIFAETVDDLPDSAKDGTIAIVTGVADNAD